MKKYILRSDLALQQKNLKLKNTYKLDNILVKELVKNNYLYTSILFKDISLKETSLLIEKILIKELRKYLKLFKIKRESTILIVGLGNENITSDSIGVNAVKKVQATKHFLDLNIKKPAYLVTKLIPNTTNNTGIMTFNNILALTKYLKPNLVIVIDALVCSNIKYLNHLIEINNEGLRAGSGMFNYQKEIGKKTLNTNVLTIGIPTAIEIFIKNEKMIVASKDIDIYVNNMSKIISNGLNKLFKTI